jgi:hypothetical protein
MLACKANPDCGFSNPFAAGLSPREDWKVLPRNASKNQLKGTGAVQ